MIDTMQNEKRTDSTDRDPRRPTVRLSEADKKVSLAIERLEAEAEYVDPDLIQRLESAVEEIRSVDRELRTLEREVSE